MKRLLFLALLCAITNVEVHAQNLRDYSWLSGDWTFKQGSNTTIESWSLRNDTTLVGSSVTTDQSGTIVFEEALKIQKAGKSISYVALLPSKIAKFRLKKYGKNVLIFEDSKNEYPSIITYKKMESHLEVTLEGSGKKEVMKFTKNKP